VAWLLKQAEWLVTAGRRELAACKWEEALGHQEALITVRRSSDSPRDSAENTRLARSYAITCVSLAQCQVQMGHCERAAATYSRLLENRKIFIPNEQRKKFTQQRDEWTRVIRKDDASAARSATVPYQNALGEADIRQGGASFGRRSRTGAGFRDGWPEPGPFAGAAAARVTRPRPKVTVVTACHDAEPHLAECLDSILRQTLPEWELFLLDDGSTDGTRRIMEDCAARDARIRPFFFDDNAGPYVRRNFAIEQADAPFVVIQDADDVMCPEKLERLYHAITQDERLGVVGSFYHMFLDKYQGPEHCEMVVLKTTHEQILEEYRTSAICDFCWHGSAIIRKQMFADIGPYDQNPFASDSYWLAKVVEYAWRSDQVRLMNIPDVLTLRRMHVGSQTGSLPAFDPRSRRAKFREYRHEKLSEVIRQLDSDPRADVPALLRRAVCSDFIEKNGHLFGEWERAPLTPRMVQSLIGRICTHFTSRQFVRCIVTSQIVEQLVEGIAENVRSYELVKGLAYFALGHPWQARACVDRESRIHGTPEAARFRTEWLDRDDGQWTRAQRLSAIEKGIFLGDPGEPTVPLRCLLEHGAKSPTGLSVILSLAADAMPWAELLASFNAQTARDFEVIALTRGTAPDDLASPAPRIGFRLTVFDVGPGAGWSAPRTAATKRAQGRYVAFLGEHVLPDRDFVRCTLQHIRQAHPSGLRGRVLCEGRVSHPIRFDLGPEMRHAACDIDELCVFDKETFFRLGGFPAMPFDHGAIQLSCRLYADPHEGRRSILYCPDVVGRYRGPEEPRTGHVDRFVLENRFAIGQLLQSHCLREDQEPEAWSFLMFVRGTGLTNTWTEDERYQQYLQNSLFFRKRHPRLAIEWAEKTLERHPDSIKAKCVLGSAYTLLGRSADACVCLEGILAPLERLLAWERLDCTQREFHDYGYIVECYVGACTQLAECYMKTGRYDRVADIYARLLENRHIHLEPAQRQSMERVRDRLTHSATKVTEALPSRAVGPGLSVTPVNRDGARMNHAEAARAPVGRRSSKDEALDEQHTQVLAELERKYRSMPSKAPGRHAAAVRLSELFRRAGRTSKSKAFEIEAKTIGNTIAYEKARQSKTDVCSHRPAIVEFNVITQCNGGCIMCSYGTDGEILDLAQFQRLADEWLPAARDAHLIGGEVLLHPQFYELCEYANRFNVSLGMTTNLSTLAGRRAEAIQKFFRTVRVSVDGATKQTYESIRTRLNFDRLCRNLEVLADIRRGKPGLELELVFVAMRQNIAELPAVIEMASRYTFKRVAVDFVHAYNAQTLDNSLLFHRELANTYLDLARAEAAQLGLVVDIPDNFDLRQMPYVASAQLTAGHKQCTRPWQRVRLLIHGEVIPCCHLHDLAMGNALTESFEQVWNGERFRGLRQAIRDSRDEMPERCKHCQILMRGADSNDAMLHISPALVPELMQRLQTLSSTPSVAAAAAPAPHVSMPAVSVVLACRNEQKHLSECLDSVLKQTFSEWELLLLDDGSTDDTRGIIEAYAARDARIRPFYFDESAGPYIRRNFAIRQTRAPFVTIQDADDIMCPDKLRRLHKAMVDDECLGVVGSFYRSFLDEFTGIGHTEAVTLPTTHEQILQIYRTQHIWDFLWHGSAIIRRDVFDTIGLYDENPFGADSFWLAKVAEYACHTGRIRLRTIPEFLTLRRVHGDSQTGLLPTMDPRSRRVAYVEYCLEKLKEVANRATHDPRVDLARALRECTCGDFLQQRGAQAAAREHQPVDDRAVDHLLQRALRHFRERRYVTCVRTLRGLETMDATIPRRVTNFDLVRAIALYGLGQEEKSRICLRREMANHGSPMAGQWHDAVFERGMRIDVRRWCAEHADTLPLRITDTSRSEPSPAADDRGRTTAKRPPKLTVVTAGRNVGRFRMGLTEAEPGRSPAMPSVARV